MKRLLCLRLGQPVACPCLGDIPISWADCAVHWLPLGLVGTTGKPDSQPPSFWRWTNLESFPTPHFPNTVPCFFMTFILP